MDPAEEVEMMALRHQTEMNSIIDNFDTPIQKFYIDAVVFVTGGSGFIGKQLVEKLFRSCRLKKMFVLIRSRKGQTGKQRLDSMLENPIFDTLRSKQFDFVQKLVPIEGDVQKPKLGISEEDMSSIIKETTIIIHMAATIRFDEQLNKAALINVRGTMDIINIAKQCSNLRKLIHVSTTYSHTDTSQIGKDIVEDFLPSPLPPKTMITLAETIGEDQMDKITPELIGGWPNTYSFTKAIAEEAIRLYASDLPVCIVRPPIVTPCYYDPAPGWLDLSCIYGNLGILFGVGLGVLHVFLINIKLKMVLAPVDYVNNAVISAGWDSAEKKKKGEIGIPIYNVANPNYTVTWDYLSSHIRGPCKVLSSPTAVWHGYLIETHNKYLYWVLTWLLHYIPAYILDGIAYIIPIRPKNIPSFVKIYKKVTKLIQVFSYFTTNEWIIQAPNLQAMHDKMTPEDKAIFNFDFSKIDWPEYIKVMCIGLRKYITKDGLKNSAYGVKKQNIFSLINYVVTPLYFYTLWCVFKLFFSLICYPILSFFMGLVVKCVCV